jgi:multicomponent Na+:H+ antiporter subunit A
VLIAVAIAIAALMAGQAKQRMSAVLLVGTTGFGMVALFALHGAPDLALTQALVEMVTLVVFVLVLRRLPTRIAQRNKPVKRILRATIGVAVGVIMAVVAVIALGARQATSIGAEWPRLAVEDAHGRNIVNVVLVDIRAWDTMGEISVLVVVATGIASLLFVTGRAGAIPRLQGSKQQRRGQNRRRVIVDPLAPGPEASSNRMSWLLAGRALAPDHRSVLLEVLVRLLFHPAILVSVYLLFAGHNAPGGGFAGGLLAGLALVARYLAGGRYELAEAIPVDAGKILGAGLILAVGTAIGSLFFGGEALQSAYFETDVPLLGHLSFGTSTIFDFGVYLVVVGLTLDILRSLGAEIDRQQEDADLADEAHDDFSESEAAR